MSSFGVEWAMMLSQAMGRSGKGYRQWPIKRGPNDRRGDKTDAKGVPINQTLRRYKQRYT